MYFITRSKLRFLQNLLKSDSDFNFLIASGNHSMKSILLVTKYINCSRNIHPDFHTIIWFRFRFWWVFLTRQKYQCLTPIKNHKIRLTTCQYFEQTINTVLWLYVQQRNVWAFKHRICFDSSSQICCWPWNNKIRPVQNFLAMLSCNNIKVKAGTSHIHLGVKNWICSATCHISMSSVCYEHAASL